MAPTGDAPTVVVAFGVGSTVCVCAAPVCDHQGAGVGALFCCAAQVGVERYEGGGIAAVRSRLARAQALRGMSPIGDQAAVICTVCCGEEAVETCGW